MMVVFVFPVCYLVFLYTPMCHGDVFDHFSVCFEMKNGIADSFGNEYSPTDSIFIKNILV